MNNLQEFYRKIEYLRSNGVKMKEIADWIDMAPSILSSLYTTVLPNYFEGIKSYPPEEALDSALALVNNVSKKRLLSHIEEMILRLDQMELAEPDSLKDNPFAKQLMEETRLSASKIEAFKGIYTSYSLSSSSDCLKMEPFLLSPSDNQVRVGRISAYGEAQWGFGIMPDPQNFHCMLNEKRPNSRWKRNTCKYHFSRIPANYEDYTSGRIIIVTRLPAESFLSRNQKARRSMNS